MQNLRTLLALHDFRYLWLGQVVSNFGDGLTSLALLLLINHLTGSTAALGTLMVVLALPQVTVGMLAGVYVDRLDRRRILLASDALRALGVLGFLFVDSTEQVWLLYLFGFLQAAVGTFFGPARMALVAQIVPEEQLLAANSISQSSHVIARVLGTALAGVLIGSFGSYRAPFLLDTATFLASFFFISRVARRAISVEQAAGDLRAILTQFADGLRVIRRTRALVGTLVGYGVMSLGVGAANVLLIPLIVDDLGLPETWFGALQAAQAAAMVLGGMLVATLLARLRPTTVVSAGIVLFGVVVAATGAVTNIWQIALILFLSGLIYTPANAAAATITQTTVDDAVRGRTGATLNTLTSTANLLSMGLAGVLAEWLGTRTVFALGGGVTLLAGLLAALIFRGVPKPTLPPKRAKVTVTEP